MRRNWVAAAAAFGVVLLAGGAAVAMNRPEPAPAARPTSATLTVVGATANVYGAAATETVIGAPMPLSELTDTVVVVIVATDGIGSCEIKAGGVRVAYASTSQGQQAVCIWNRR